MKRVPVMLVCGLGEPYKTEMTAKVLCSDTFEVVEMRYDGMRHIKVTHNYVRSPSEDVGAVPTYREVGRGAVA